MSPWNEIFIFDIRFDCRKMHGSLDAYSSFDRYDGHDSHDKFSIPRQAGKGLILPKNLLLADASMVFYLQLCRHTVCRKLV